MTTQAVPGTRLLAAHLDELAKRLLDLSNRNRLLNLRHAAKSRNHIRIIDEVPEFLFEALRSGRAFTFRGIKKVAAPAGDTVVRAKEAQPEVAETARKEGLNPSFDLPAPSEATEERHRDAFLQVLHFREDLERRLEGIRQDYEGLRQELGIPSLFACFGFLEWFESESAEKSMLAPLVLLPLHLEREREPGGARYRVAATSDDPDMNLTLAKRLDEDFHVRLPVWAMDGSLADYFRAVEEVVASQPRWRLRRYVTVAILHFSRQVMYEAMQKARQAGSLAEPHPVLERLLVGGEAEPEVEPAEAPSEAGPEPFLIDVADGSQSAAVQDALSGRNLVIKGPPGTGKSQTITNLVAAALERGEKVLFVADKMAALDVVKNRLEAAGIGPFCLELHSTKASKRKVLDALARALQTRDTSLPPGDLDEKRRQLAEHRATLDRYVAVMQEPAGALGMTVHEALGREQRLRPRRDEYPNAVLALYLPHSASLTDAARTADIQLLESLERAFEAVADTDRGERRSPWRWIGRTELSPVAQSALLASIQRWQRATATAIGLLERLPAAIRPLDVAGLASVAELAGQLPHGESVDEALADLVTHENARPLAELVNSLEKRNDRWSAAAQVVARPNRAYARTGEIATLFESVRSAGLEIVRRDRLSAVAASYDAEAGRLEQAALNAHAFAERHGFSAPGQALRALFAARNFARSVPAGVIRYRSSALADPTVATRLLDASAKASALRAARERLKVALPGWRQATSEELTGHAVAIRTSGFFARLFGGAYRRGRSSFLALSVGRPATRTEMADSFEDLSAHIDEWHDLASDPGLAALCGSAWDGAVTDFGLVLKVHEWSCAVAASLSGSPAHVSARRLLLEGTAETVAELAQLFDPVQDAPIESYLTSGVADPVAAARIWRGEAVRLRGHIPLCDDVGLVDGMTVEGVGRLLHDLNTVGEMETAIALNEIGRAAVKDHAARVGQRPQDMRRPIELFGILARLQVPPRMAGWLLGGERLRRLGLLRSVANEARSILSELGTTTAAVRQGGFDLDRALAARPSLEEARALADDLLSSSEEISTWVGFARAREAARRHDRVSAVVHAFGDAPFGGIARAYEWLVYRSLAMDAERRHPDLKSMSWSGAQMEVVRREFIRLDREVLALHGKDLAGRLSRRRIPPGRGTGPRATWTDLALVRNEIGKKQKLLPIRQLMRRAGQAILEATPCFMMSPHSVAQFLDDSSVRFDLLVVDEASQMKPEEACLPISRATRIAVVGDDQQLPPTTFFDRLESSDDEVRDEDEEVIDERVAAESILDLALAAYPRARHLRWHYRSRHPSLIAFSNQEFYEGNLLVFPSPSLRSGDAGIAWRRIQGEYSASVNPPEAEAVATAACRLMRERPDCSIGVVALNKSQADLIRELVDVGTDGGYEARWKDTIYPFFVKNLENVQGDERDIIIISMTYGPAAGTTKLRQNFGPINGRYGHRRLNVLFTRARQQVAVFSSMDANLIQLQPGSQRGVRVLRDYLAYAAQGGTVLPAAGESLARVESPFEEMVARELLREGYELEAQIGVNGFFIDLGVKHPRFPHGFVCGVECDGATYHSLKPARDRDRIRQEILEALGWRLVRVWSTDWFRDPRTARAKLVDSIERLTAEQLDTGASEIGH